MYSSYYQPLQQALLTFGPVPLVAWEAVAQRLQVVRCRRDRGMLLGRGRVFFLVEGLLKEEIDDGREVYIQQFVCSGDFFTAPAPGSGGQLVAIEAATALALAQQDLYELNREHPELASIYEGIIAAIQQQLISRIRLLFISKRQRYAAFRQTYPGLAARLLDKDVMAYLAMSPSYFSRTK
ncbi:hypothetical protein SAMN05421740_105113 [Parapedobacter koreensis]|uniref:cAMP-binding domain of CRP or a regulatory subunit of cAMP-dependent protein kinases n=2 Tax=Parapedobacter koreensis TaxID=332977 RepID=A0A1H7Q0T9_9SPHI|nr:hypothetical protein SAMN05421740_105113 [Parapedobacter koreensis]